MIGIGREEGGLRSEKLRERGNAEALRHGKARNILRRIFGKRLHVGDGKREAQKVPHTPKESRWNANTQKGGKLSLTGNLGDVMKESAQLALEYIKSHNKQLGISDEDIENHSVHIHVPEGAIPKDGPSAGIAILTALVSSFTGKKVKNRLAMTGEITLRGKLLPVGGIKEKILAAKRAGIKEIILCIDNQKDVNEIQQEYLDGLKFHFVRNMADALAIAIEK